MTGVFSDFHKAVRVVSSRSERPFTLLEMPPIVIVTISSVFYTKEQGRMLDGKGKEMLLT